MSDVKTVIKTALIDAFKSKIAELSGNPFEKSGVTLPSDAVWENKAEYVFKALEKEGYLK